MCSSGTDRSTFYDAAAPASDLSSPVDSCNNSGSALYSLAEVSSSLDATSAKEDELYTTLLMALAPASLLGVVPADTTKAAEMAEMAEMAKTINATEGTEATTVVAELPLPIARAPAAAALSMTLRDAPKRPVPSPDTIVRLQARYGDA